MICQITLLADTGLAMIQLTVLGRLELHREDGSLVGSVLSQPRRVALLVYLCMEAHSGGVQRDRLLGMFWPELPQEQGRTSLRTALHFLRRSLGAGVLTGHGSAVGIDVSQLGCDAAAFRDAARAGRAQEALDLYGGDLLPGFYLDDGPAEFERWLEETRSGLRREAAGAAWRLATEQEAEGNAAGAGAWARRAVQLSEGDESEVRRAMELLARVGDRVGALSAYQDLARRLRADFDAAPSEATESLMCRVRDVEPGAADPMAGVARPEPEAVEAAQPSTVVPEAEDARGVGRGRWSTGARRLARRLYSAGVTAALVVAFYSLWGLSRGAPAAETGVVPVLAVEEIRDFSPRAATPDLAGALTLELSARLADIQTLRVVVPGRAAAAATPPAYVLRTGLIRSDSMVRLTAVLLDGVSGATLERITAERPLAEPAAMTAELGEFLTRRVRREIGRLIDDRERDARARNPRALALVRAGIRDMQVGDSLAVAGAAEAAAAALDAADAQLAAAQGEASHWAEPSVQRAELVYRRMWLHLSPPAPDVNEAAGVLMSGLTHAETALAVSPDDPAALELRGLLRYWRWRLGSTGAAGGDEQSLSHAEADLRRATELEAPRGRAWSTLSAVQEARGDFAAANLAARQAHRADPYLENAIETVVRLFKTSLEIGDYAAARSWCEEIASNWPRSWLRSYCVLEQMAWQGPMPGVAADSVRALIMRGIQGSPGGWHARADFEMLGAVVLARLGSPGAEPAIRSASALDGADDARILTLQAWAHLTLGDEVAAARLLAEAAVKDPAAARSVLLSRRFESLRADPRLLGYLAVSR